MTEARPELPISSPQQQRENAREDLTGEIKEFLQADYRLMSGVHFAIEKGVTPEEIRAELADFGLAEEADRALAAPSLLARIDQVLTEAGIAMRAPADGEELWLDVSSPRRRGVMVQHGDGGAGPSQPPDLEFMRQVAEVAVPALYDAGYQLASLDARRIIPLDRDQALAEFSRSTDDFAVLVGDHCDQSVPSPATPDSSRPATATRRPRLRHR